LTNIWPIVVLSVATDTLHKRPFIQRSRSKYSMSGFAKVCEWRPHDGGTAGNFGALIRRDALHDTFQDIVGCDRWGGSGILPESQCRQGIARDEPDK
jgi:hypothetical protein